MRVHRALMVVALALASPHARASFDTPRTRLPRVSHASALHMAVTRAHTPESSVLEDIEQVLDLTCQPNVQCVVSETATSKATDLGILVSKDSTVTELWTHEDWSKHTNHWRYLRHLSYWYRSTVVRSLTPALLCLASWTLLVCRMQWKLPLPALGLAASPLALLLAFRVNAATARFNEARAQWGRAVLHARNLASIVACVPALPSATRALYCRLLCSLGWAMKAKLRNDPDLPVVLNTLLPHAEAAWVCGARKPPLAILTLLRRATAPLELKESVDLSISTCISELNACFGGMERLFSTPLSPTYMRHTSRGLLLWLSMLPAGLVSGGVAALPATLIVVATAYVMLGIDEIGIQIEQPFDCLPLQGMSSVMTRDVADELFPSRDVPIPEPPLA